MSEPIDNRIGPNFGKPMSEPTLYRINGDKLKSATAATLLRRLMQWKALVPVERCKHGNIDGHVIAPALIRDPDNADWCPGGIGGDE